MNSSEIICQLIGKSKEFCYTFYMLLDRLQTNLTNDTSSDNLFAKIISNENKVDTANAKALIAQEIEKPPIPQNEANASQKDDETAIALSDGESDNTPIMVPDEEVKEPIKPEERKKPSRYNGYLLYYKSIVGELKKVHPTFGFTDMAKIVSSKWKALSTEERREWNVKSNPSKYKKISKKRVPKADHGVRKKRKAPIEIIKEDPPQPLIPVCLFESKEIKLKMEACSPPIEMSNDSDDKSNKLDYDSIVNQRAELKRKLLQENAEHPTEILPKAPQQLLLPGSASSLF